MRSIPAEKVRADFEQTSALCRQAAGFVALHASEYAPRPDSSPTLQLYYDDAELPLLKNPWANSSLLTVPGELVHELAPRAARRLKLGETITFNRRNSFDHYYIDPHYQGGTFEIPDDPYDIPQKALKPMEAHETIVCHVDQVWSDGREVSVRLDLFQNAAARHDAESLSPLFASEVPDSPLQAECHDLSKVLDALSGLWPEQVMRYTQASAEFDDAWFS